jgi:hypothetical protein
MGRRGYGSQEVPAPTERKFDVAEESARGYLTERHSNGTPLGQFRVLKAGG